MGYPHIVFDIDGTLMDSGEGDLTALQATLRETTGRDYATEELAFCLGLPGRDSLKRLGVPDIEGTLALWEEKAAGKTIAPFPGIRELLTGLLERGCRLGVASSRSVRSFQVDIAPFLPLAERFGTVVLADHTELHKPDPDPLLKYMELTGAGPGDVLYVGDSPYDSQCAQGAGVDFALAVWGCHTKDRPAQYYPETPGELLALL